MGGQPPFKFAEEKRLIERRAAKRDSGNPSEASVFASCMMIWEKNLTALLPKARWCKHDTSFELVVHTTLAVASEHKKLCTMGLIQFDFRNSYNLVSQLAFK